MADHGLLRQQVFRNEHQFWRTRTGVIYAELQAGMPCFRNPGNGFQENEDGEECL